MLVIPCEQGRDGSIQSATRVLGERIQPFPTQDSHELEPCGSQRCVDIQFHVECDNERVEVAGLQFQLGFAPPKTKAVLMYPPLSLGRHYMNAVFNLCCPELDCSEG
jgi:hypothetical protein